MQNVRKVTVKSRLEQVKIVLIGEATSWESVQQGSGSWKESIALSLNINLKLRDDILFLC